MGWREATQLPSSQEPSRRRGGTLFLLSSCFQDHGEDRHTPTKAKERDFRHKSMRRAKRLKPICILEWQLAYLWGFTGPSKFRPYTCYLLAEHPTVLFSEARVKHLGVQDWPSPLWCELPKSPLCGPRFLPLQTGLLRPHAASFPLFLSPSGRPRPCLLLVLLLIHLISLQLPPTPVWG